MKNTLAKLIVAVGFTGLVAQSAIAQTEVMHVPSATRIWNAVPGMVLYSVVGMFLLFGLFKVFDFLLTKIDIVEELKKGNVAVGLFAAAFVLSIGLIIAAAMF